MIGVIFLFALTFMVSAALIVWVWVEHHADRFTLGPCATCGAPDGQPCATDQDGHWLIHATNPEEDQ